MGWQDLALSALRWAPDSVAATAVAAAIIAAQPCLAAALVRGLLLRGMSGCTEMAASSLAAGGAAAAMLASVQRHCGGLTAYDQQRDCLHSIASYAAACLTEVSAADGETSAAADDSSADAGTAVVEACGALAELLTAWPHLAAPPGSAAGVIDAADAGAPQADGGTAAVSRTGVVDSALHEQLWLVAARLEPVILQQMQGLAAGGEAAQRRFQAACHLRTRLTLLGIAPLVSQQAAPAASAAGHAPASLPPPMAAGAPVVPDWRAALMSSGSVDGSVNGSARRSSTLCERLLAELLLRSLPDRQAAVGPVYQDLLQLLGPKQHRHGARQHSHVPARSESASAASETARQAGRQELGAAAQHLREQLALSVPAACSPLALAAAALGMLHQLGAGGGGMLDAAVAWRAVCGMFASVAADVADAEQQRALLLLCSQVGLSPPRVNRDDGAALSVTHTIARPWW